MIHDTLNQTTLKIVEKFGASSLRRSLMSLRNADKIIAECMTPRPKTVIEIGTFRGVTTAYIAQLCDMVHTIDLRNGQHEEMTNKNETSAARDEIWNHIGVINKIKFYAINQNNEKWHILRAIDNNFDFAIIDGNSDDTDNDFHLVKSCKRVLFHDCMAGNIGINRLVAKLAESESGNVKFFYNNPHSNSDVFAYWTA